MGGARRCDAPLACWFVMDPNGNALSVSCPTDPAAAAPIVDPRDGLYPFDVYSPVTAPPQDYRFSVGLDAPAPPLD